MEGDHRSLVTFHDDEVEAIGQGELGDFLFKLTEILGRKEKRQPQDGAQAKYSHDISIAPAD